MKQSPNWQVLNQQLALKFLNRVHQVISLTAWFTALDFDLVIAGVNGADVTWTWEAEADATGVEGRPLEVEATGATGALEVLGVLQHP